MVKVKHWGWAIMVAWLMVAMLGCANPSLGQPTLSVTPAPLQDVKPPGVENGTDNEEIQIDDPTIGSIFSPAEVEEINKRMALLGKKPKPDPIDHR